ncbi:site-2 protease family protein [Candidatus Bipolaricaulota bacterium]|nr:site-2 protease family protein [Candidatus Bipolaricaulota bacterium]
MTFAGALEIVLSLIAVFTAIVLHEFSHGYIAFRLGDPTAKIQGRLTLNPLAHIDPIGTILVPIVLVILRSPFLFGWAKPVPVNPNYFRNPYKGMFYVAIAGPLMNIALALGASAIGRLAILITPLSLLYGRGFSAYFVQTIFYLLGFFVIINIILAVFNLLPVPPLDGSRVLTYFLPPEGKRVMMQLERYGFLIVLALLYLGALRGLIGLISGIWEALLGSYWPMGIAG